MATTNSGFIRATLSGIIQLLTAPAQAVSQVSAALSGSRIDLLAVDASRSGYAKNGAVRVALVGTTPVTIDLTNTVTTAQSYAGDVTFAGWSQIIVTNDGTAAVTVTPSVSNGASLPFTALTLQPGDFHVFTAASPVGVGSSARDITVTPTAGGSLILVVEGN